MVYRIPLIAVPSQDLEVTLNNQRIGLHIFQKTAPPFALSTALYMNVELNGDVILNGIICQNGNRIVRDDYLGFSGDLGFYDTTGLKRDPVWTGLGTEYILLWFSPEELEAG